MPVPVNMSRQNALLVACFLVFGCADSAGPALDSIAIQTDRVEYEPVQLIIVTTTNRSGSTVYDDHCSGGTEGYELLRRWNGSYGAGRACTDATSRTNPGVAIPSGTVHSDTFHVNGQSYTGTWRVNLALRMGNGALISEALRVSNTFHVRGNWVP
jgi:hypothetical protein